MSWINETLKLNWCKTCRKLVVAVINLCKVNFMPCITLYTESSQIYIKYLIFHDFIEIYSFLINNFFFIMLEKCFSIAPTSFPNYIQNIKTHIECFSCWSRPTTMWTKVFYQINFCTCFLDPSPESVYWSCMIWFSISYE